MSTKLPRAGRRTGTSLWRASGWSPTPAGHCPGAGQLPTACVHTAVPSPRSGPHHPHSNIYRCHDAPIGTPMARLWAAGALPTCSLAWLTWRGGRARSMQRPTLRDRRSHWGRAWPLRSWMPHWCAAWASGMWHCRAAGLETIHQRVGAGSVLLFFELGVQHEACKGQCYCRGKIEKWTPLLVSVDLLETGQWVVRHWLP
jgi:hypothetical protein